MEGYEGRISAVEAELRDLGSVAICFSGGLDSTVLADISHRILGDRAVAVMCDVPMLADRQRAAGVAVAEAIGIRLVTTPIPMDDLSGILSNGHDRCYICKTSMYRHVRAAAESLGIPNVINGEIVEDLGEDRPGMAAGPENRILTPFLDAGVHRADVVRYLSGMDLPIHLVKETCMLMRYPEGRPVTADDLRLVEALEGEVRAELGIAQLRVRRTDGGFAVQTSSVELPVLEKGFDRIVPLFSSRGYQVSLNPVGYDK